LFAGCAAHAILPFDKLLTGAVGLLFAFTGHLCDWPVARGGSRAIADALAGYFRSLGGEIATGHEVRALRELPTSRVVLFDLAPKQVAAIAGDSLPSGYLRRLSRYRYGSAVFKLDWALSGPIPWKDPACARASTVHLGGTLNEIAASEAAAYRGEHSDRPFVLVAQQSLFDSSRAPAGKHTGYAYCHVPHGSDFDMTARIEAQAERFAPGFADVVRIIFGYDPSRRQVLGMMVLESKETPGLGDKIIKDSLFVAEFDGVAAPLVGVKAGSGAGDPGEVDMITGATISSRTVIAAIEDRLAVLRPLIEAHEREAAR